MTLKQRQPLDYKRDIHPPPVWRDTPPGALGPRVGAAPPSGGIPAPPPPGGSPRPAPPGGSPRPAPAAGATQRHTTRTLLQEEQLPPAEHVLQEAVRRALRKPEGRIAVVMHLSAMTAPAPHPHHRRIARSVMEEAAQRHDGEVHILGNGDAVLLCRLPQDGDPSGFRDALQYLFQVDAVQPPLPISIWHLEHEGEAVLAYVTERLTGNNLLQNLPKPSLAHLAGEPDLDAAPEPADIARLPTPQAIGAIAGLLRRQTAVRLQKQDTPPGARPRAARLRPLFREISVGMTALERRVPSVRQARSDPFLLRTLSAELDELLLEAMLGDLPETAGLLPARGETAIPVHLNLSVASILSPAFARFAERPRAAAIEVQLIELCADPGAFAQARARVAAAGCSLVLDGISHIALSLMAPGALRADMVKLEWSPRLLHAPQVERDRIDAALAALAPGTLVLDRVDSEEAMRWGLERDVRNFQGRYTDVLQATQRLGTCAAGKNCTLRQCASRAEAATPAPRVECGNNTMLDHGPDQELADRLAARASHKPYVAPRGVVR